MMMTVERLITSKNTIVSAGFVLPNGTPPALRRKTAVIRLASQLSVLRDVSDQVELCEIVRKISY
jgi:hypothetical protein